MRKSNSVHSLAINAFVAAAYAALTVALGFMSYNGIQFRVAEALCVLPFFFPGTVWGLFIGRVISNLMSPAGLLDIVFGSLATLGCCLAIRALGKGKNHKSWPRCIAACAMPVIFNAVIVGAVLAFTIAEPGMAFGTAYAIFGAQVGFGELVVMAVLGLPLVRMLPSSTVFKWISERLS